MAENKALVEGYNRILLGTNGKIIDTQAVYFDSVNRYIFSSTEGTDVEEECPQWRFSTVPQPATGRIFNNLTNLMQVHSDLSSP